ncbi:hypothetical protein [Brasilonema sp. UFV-L1]|uniref:hypothetical protein n=1 Tax=Brasilonema sp. UFV-L1 TaxID=2234130 RepID=UPI00145DC226|nr:hypothetical protein [Brasilonema sp. UFV-L1]NMG07487.1 hypothetical protein [Brasilonema sp. UFV-L1]
MIFIIPIILGAAALITAGVGVAAGVDGVSKIEEAKKLGKAAQKRYEQKQKSVESALQVTQDLAEEYGQLQIQIKLQTIGRLVTFIERIGQQASQSDMEFLEGLEGVSPQQLQEYKTAALEAQRFAEGGFTAVGAAYAAGQGTVALVGLFGTASTGAAIGGLSGAAAWNATLAWLGGGSLATGGGGMALGTLVLGGIAVGPALMIGGFVLGEQGEKALTEARDYEAKANTEIAKLSAFEDFLGQVQQRITELKELVEGLNDRAINGLVELESKPFVRERDAAKFQQVALLIKALAKIMKTPILDAEGNLNQATARLKASYNTI